MNPLRALNDLGQSVWLDNLRRTDIKSGFLKKLIDEDGLKGLTSNPTIFQRSVESSKDYQDLFDQYGGPQGLQTLDVYTKLVVRDIQDAADLFRGVFNATDGRDGYVSLEVSPLSAFSTEDTLTEARALWKAVDRPNLMIKVPATTEGIPAIRALLSEGMNINITLLFAQETYRQVAEAYVDGLELFAKSGGDVRRVASVASFFVSRIDTLVDGMIEKKLEAGVTDDQKALLNEVSGKVAIANAKLAYKIYQEIFATPRWKRLVEQGARTQRVLWASTSAKNPKFRDVIYVEELIGPDTVNTMPPATVDAFRDHGKPRISLTEDVPAAEATMKELAKAGISMKEVTDELVRDGVKSFSESFDKLISSIGEKIGRPVPAKVNGQTLELPKALADAVESSLQDWQEAGKVKRLWAKDAALWTKEDEPQWMGWLESATWSGDALAPLKAFAEEVKKEGFTHALLLGMGGSSLCPEVLKLTFGKKDGFPELFVLDSTDPDQVKTVEGKVDLKKTLFLVASKSGSTLEPSIFQQYFFERTEQAVGKGLAGRQFVAITDPGSKLEGVAKALKFRRIFAGVPGIGGRYSALSNFGRVPAAVMGLDLEAFAVRTQAMVAACGPASSARDNPGVVLGTVMGVAGKMGRDKVTLVASPGIGDLGAWLEQLIAESTGKNGKGLIPIDREPLANPASYGTDRLFAYLRLSQSPDAAQDAAVNALSKAGHPVVRISVEDPLSLGQEFFRWEIATAVAGSLLGINPFNQPDVEASKVATRKLTDAFESSGRLPAQNPVLEDGMLAFFTDAKNAESLVASQKKGAAPLLAAHFARLKANDYFGLLAYIEMNPAHAQLLERIRCQVRDARKVATCAQFGPRFLHSTGQAYKGGPDSGVFLQVTHQPENDLPVPGQKYTFGVVQAAQAQGDFEVLIERKRRALRVHLSGNLEAALKTLEDSIRKALN